MLHHEGLQPAVCALPAPVSLLTVEGRARIRDPVDAAAGLLPQMTIAPGTAFSEIIVPTKDSVR
jgi:hypothetical protein